MSHYNVNAGVPKTLIQHLIRWVITSGEFSDEVGEILQSVLDTEITPELVPTGEDEEIQSSEAKVGPYALQDFALFYALRYGFSPSKIAYLAWHAWSDPDRGDWPPGFRPTSGRLTRSTRFGSGYRFSRSATTVQPILLFGSAQRAQGVARRIAVAAGRLARSVGHGCDHVADPDRTRCSWPQLKVGCRE